MGGAGQRPGARNPEPGLTGLKDLSGLCGLRTSSLPPHDERQVDRNHQVNADELAAAHQYHVELPFLGAHVQVVWAAQAGQDVGDAQIGGREGVKVHPAEFAGATRFEAELRDVGARSVQRMIESAAQRAGIQQKVTPHLLRHTFATRFLRAGGDLATTSRYLHPDARKVQEMVEEL